jgi:hypothetical protein
VSLGGPYYLTLAAVLFTIGAVGLLLRRNVLVMFMCVELMLNAVNLTFVTFSRLLNDIGGQSLVSSCWWWRRPRWSSGWASSSPSSAAERAPRRMTSTS